jgi:hypothetical protein
MAIFKSIGKLPHACIAYRYLITPSLIQKEFHPKAILSKSYQAFQFIKSSWCRYRKRCVDIYTRKRLAIWSVCVLETTLVRLYKVVTILYLFESYNVTLAIIG